MQRCLISKVFLFCRYYITLLLLLFWSLNPFIILNRTLFEIEIEPLVQDRKSNNIYSPFQTWMWSDHKGPLSLFGKQVLKVCGLNQYTVWDYSVIEWMTRCTEKKGMEETVGLKDVLSVWGDSGGKWTGLQSSLLSRRHASFTSGSNDIDYQHSSISLPN